MILSKDADGMVVSLGAAIFLDVPTGVLMWIFAGGEIETVVFRLSTISFFMIRQL